VAVRERIVKRETDRSCLACYVSGDNSGWASNGLMPLGQAEGCPYQNEGPRKSISVLRQLAQEVRHDGRDNNARNELRAAGYMEREERVVRGFHAVFARHDAELEPVGTIKDRKIAACEYQTQCREHGKKRSQQRVTG
jgi:hypothetical protein